MLLSLQFQEFRRISNLITCHGRAGTARRTAWWKGN
jgi:hypothetical protein